MISPQGALQKSVNVGNGKAITSIYFSQEYRDILVQLEDDVLIITNVEGSKLQKVFMY
jgi:hypothetical protein